jgi:hypothetical protein
MSLLWPGFLYLLLLIPLSIAVYVWVLRRPRRFAVRYSSLSLIREAAAKQSWLRRHLPFSLFLLAIASLVLALGRPVATVIVPSNKATVILAMDVSRSMCATDIAPNRLTVAKNVALSFVRNETSGRQVGIVAFAGFAEVVQMPTTDLRLLENAITYMAPARRTAIGSAILRSLDAIAEVDERDRAKRVGRLNDRAANGTGVLTAYRRSAHRWREQCRTSPDDCRGAGCGARCADLYHRIWLEQYELAHELQGR